MKQSRTNSFALALAALAGAALATACGDDGGAAQDAATADASDVDSGPPPDAALPDAVPPGPATITINDPEGTPVEGVDVVFHDETGAVISLKATDQNGEATETVPGGAMITVANSPEAGVFALNTLGDVQPGDEIVVSDFGAAGEMEPAEAGTAEIVWPGAVEDADLYEVTEGCNTTETDTPETTDDLAVSTACQHGNDEFHVVAQAFTPATGMLETDTLHAVSALQDQALTMGTAALMLDDWSTQFQSASGTMMNTPEGAAAFFADGNFILDGHTFDMIDEEIAFSEPAVQAVVPEGMAPDAVNLNSAAIFVSGMELSGFVALQVNVAGLPDSDVAVDFAMAPRPATNGSFDASDPARPVIDWDAEGTASAADLTQLNLAWTDTVNDEASEHTWNVFTNPDENGPFQFPELPADLSDFAPTADSTYGNQSIVYLASSFVTEDWDTLRQLGGQSENEQPATDFTLGFSGPAMSAPSSPGPAPRVAPDTARRALRKARALEATD